MLKILFLIHDLGQGGAEKVLVNLVNNMDQSKFDITLVSLFAGGVNEQFLASHIKYRTIFRKGFPGNSQIMKVFSPKQLHNFCIKETYDIEIAYLEGPAVRIISGCQNKDTKLIAWIHCTMHSKKDISQSFRNYHEAQKCYNVFKSIVYVSNNCMLEFQKYCKTKGKNLVLYNTNDSEAICDMAANSNVKNCFENNTFSWCGVGKVIPVKAFDRLLRIQKKLHDRKIHAHLYILGDGVLRGELEKWCIENGIEKEVTFLGYQSNPYAFIANCDLFVCSSLSEGFSTAATEALILGIPVCTVQVSGMQEMLGFNNEYGVITPNDEESLFNAIIKLIQDPVLLKHYREKAYERGKTFSTRSTVLAVEQFFLTE